MKRPQPDIADKLRNDFIGNLKTVRGLRNLWGTETVNGVEVLKERQYYFKESDRSSNFEKLFKFLGAYEDIIEGKYEGIEKAWFYFNRNKEAELTVEVDNFISDNLNKMWWDPNDGDMPNNLTLTTSIVIETFSEVRVDQARIDQIVDLGMSDSALIQSITNNYNELWDMCPITQEGVGVINKGSIVDDVNKVTLPDEDDLTPNDPWLSVLARYVLRQNEIPFTVKKVYSGTVNKKLKNTFREYKSSIVLDIEIPYAEFTSSSELVNLVKDDLETVDNTKTESNKFKTKQKIKSMSSLDLEDDPDLVTRTYDLWENSSVNSDAVIESLWYEYNNKWYLRIEPLNNPRAFGIKYKDLSTYILTVLDNDYKKEKIAWYKKAIAVIVVIVAFLVAYYSGGTASGTAAKLVAASKAILAASLVLTLVALVFSVTGLTEWSAAFMEVSKFIEPLVLVATVVVVISGFYQAFEEASEAASREAVKTGVEKTSAEIAVDLIKEQVKTIVDNLIKGSTDVFSGNVLTKLSLEFSTKLIQLITYLINLKVESISERNRDLKAEYEELLEEMNRESDALQGFARIYAKPATADWSIFASQFDMPYERGGGFLSLGNIQRTTKQAIRKADYDDPAFSDILLL